MSDLLSKLALGTRHTKLIPWPGSEQMVLLRILSQADRQEAVFATERLFKAQTIDINMMTADEYEEEKLTQILWRCIRDPEKPSEAIAKDVTTFRAGLTKEDRAYLGEQYITFERDCSPSPDNMKSEEFDALVAQVKKTPEVILSLPIGSSTLRKLSRSLAEQLVISQTGSGSSSLPQKRQQTS